MTSKNSSNDEEPSDNVENVEAAMLAAGALGLGGLGGPLPSGVNASGMSDASILGAMAMTGGIEGDEAKQSDEEIPPIDVPEEEV